MQLQVPELVLCPHPLAALHATGSLTGLVLDVGHRETRAVAVARGQPLFATLTVVPVGAATVAAEASRLLAEEGADDSTAAAEVAWRGCFVRPMGGAEKADDGLAKGTSDGGAGVSGRVRACAADALFPDPPASCLAAKGIAGAVLTCLDKVPVRVRALLTRGETAAVSRNSLCKPSL